VVPRVVSLVPSATETLLALGIEPVACTRFCDQSGIPTIGGTKDPDLARIVALQPDLVGVNDEENRREDADALVAAGLTLHPISPRAVAEVGPALAALAVAVGAAPPTMRVPDAVGEWRGRSVTFVCPDTYGSSVLEHLGFANALGPGDGRYPERPLRAVARLGPDLVVLPDEPYPFAERHGAEVRAAVPGVRVELVDGRDLFWWGIRTPDALARLSVSLR
jgi:ABC-type Fe3+-hydroxamate transport system substrate-binding protein